MVVPQSVRDRCGLGAGGHFAVDDDPDRQTVTLRKVQAPGQWFEFAWSVRIRSSYRRGGRNSTGANMGWLVDTDILSERARKVPTRVRSRGLRRTRPTFM